ncbi:MAG: UDP-2,3-diacylglucosamine diphosphatase [Burkholderiales bacterium]|nr:UDP-2,3-diacylglucosamine diphosphatase [Burkholderiales bacterium]
MPHLPVLAAPDSWRTLAFMSDLHLHPTEPATFRAWQACMASAQWDALFILGDLFEVWVGDDVLADPTHGGFWRQCTDVIHQTSLRMPVYFMPGNRDFLVGPALLAASGMTGLTDPTALHWTDQRWVLSHGDALCLADKPYQAFRADVRSAAWQAGFLARPLADRLALVRQMRDASEQRKASSQAWVDVDNGAAAALLHSADATVLIHGHTHMPGTNDLGGGLTRRVLSDWDATSQPPRLQLLCASREPQAVPTKTSDAARAGGPAAQVAPPTFTTKNVPGA